jgi:hypothetical protein
MTSGMNMRCWWGALSSLNNKITRYILRVLDADAGRVEPVSVVDEQALGVRLSELGEAVQARAARRVELEPGNSPPVVVDGDFAQPLALGPGVGMDQPATPEFGE